jgi:hypothetical protein
MHKGAASVLASELLVSLVLLAGCGGRELSQAQPASFASSELRDLTHQFIRDAKAHGREPHLANIHSVKWADLRGQVKGHCLLKVDQHKQVIEGAGEVRIEKEFFDAQTACGKKFLVYHELVHCLFDGEGHSDSPTSLMYPYLMRFASEEECEGIINNYWEGK